MGDRPVTITYEANVCGRLLAALIRDADPKAGVRPIYRKTSQGSTP